MSGPLVTVGVPVYRGADRLPGLLECLATQTHANLDILISADNNDRESAEACRPFLERDPRFRLEIQPQRLGWAGNTDWTMRHRRGDFYIYQQHDDMLSPTYIADLVAAAERWPEAVLFYARVQMVGSSDIEVTSPSLLGDRRTRVTRYLRRLDWVSLRGLVRSSALAQTAGLLLSDIRPFDSFGTEFRYLAELALLGEHRHVDGPTYYKTWHGENLSAKRVGWERDYHVAAQACIAAWMAEVVPRAGESEADRGDLLRITLDRFAGRTSEAEWWVYASHDLRPGDPRAARVLARVGGIIDDQRAALDPMTPGVIPTETLTAAERASILAGAYAQLRKDGRFDPQAMVGLGWDELETQYFNAKA